MPGGVLNLIATGAENVILNSNPKKTFYKATYAKYTNFGLQKFRISCEKQPELSLINEKEFTFKIPRYADLINDTCIVVQLPNIYSPFYYSSAYKPFEFKWVKNLGTTMIKEIEIHAGGLTLAKYSGEYIQCLSHRDLSLTKKNVFDQMIGNVPELNDPGNSRGLNNTYPHSYYDSSNANSTDNCEPSIRQRKLYIPLSSWFSESSKMSIPLIALQYQELFIKITFRPIKEIYTLLDVESTETPRIAPNPNNTLHQMRRFLRKPVAADVGSNPSIITPDIWNSDIHLVSTYVFLDDPERNKFAEGNVSYLFKNIIEHNFLHESGSKKIDIYSKNCVSNYMFRFRRSDCKDTNEWTNYTNWKLEDKRPQPLVPASSNHYGYDVTGDIGAYPINLKNILINLAIVINGEYRENLFDQGVYLYMEKYYHTSGNFKEGLYHYSFALNTNRNEYQPSGSMNTSKYDKITFEYNTIEPPNNPDFKGDIICDNDGDIIGIRKTTEEMNKYNFDFKVFEERYNVLTLQGGNITLMIAN